MSETKLFSYKEGTVNIPKLVNQQLKIFYQQEFDGSLVFAQEDVLQMAVDKDKLVQEYGDFVQHWKIPFATYCHYGRFNSAFPNADNRANPRFRVKTSRGICQVCTQPAYGLLTLNLKLLKPKKIFLSQKYPVMLYLQELAQRCMLQDLWISNNHFLDIDQSWKLFKSRSPKAYQIDMKVFTEQRERYKKDLNPIYGSANDFVQALKGWLERDALQELESLPKTEIQKMETAYQIIDLLKGKDTGVGAKQ